jgi:hypothetical protein
LEDLAVADVEEAQVLLRVRGRRPLVRELEDAVAELVARHLAVVARVGLEVGLQRRRTISSALSASSSTASAAPTSAFCVAHIWKKKLSIVPSAPLAAGSPPPAATTPLGSDMLFASSTPALPLIALQARFGQP